VLVNLAFGEEEDGEEEDGEEEDGEEEDGEEEDGEEGGGHWRARGAKKKPWGSSLPVLFPSPQ
jgi:hypothetical protein